jgi:drug/metabolite transporter (DMT)-like permease
VTRISRLDWLLLLMTLIWGTNYALIKTVFRELDPHVFNALRLVLASTVMASASTVFRRRWHARRVVSDDDPGVVASIFHTPAPVTRGDLIRLAWLGLIGHCMYQYLFVGGLAQTSVANGALLVSATPVVITLLSTIGGERIGALHWAGTLLSLFGIYIVVGRGAHVTAASLRGDLMLMGAVVCWALYTIGARPLMVRHSPVGVTALSMLFGTLLYLPLAAPRLARVPWATVSALTWGEAGLFLAVRHLRVVHDLVCRGARDWRRANVGVLESAADRGDAHRLRLAGRADQAGDHGRCRGGAGRSRPDAAGSGPAADSRSVVAAVRNTTRYLIDRLTPMRERAAASEPRERSAPAKRRASERVRGSGGRSPPDKTTSRACRDEDRRQQDGLRRSPAWIAAAAGSVADGEIRVFFADAEIPLQDALARSTTLRVSSRSDN